MTIYETRNAFAEALVAIITPIVKETVREAIGLTAKTTRSPEEKTFLTIMQAAATSGLGASTIRLAIRRRQLRAQ